MLRKHYNSRRIIRKLLLVLFCLLYICIYPRPAEVYSLRLFDKAEVLFYLAQKPPIICDYVFNGINYEIRTNEKQAQSIRRAINKPLYQTVIFSGDMDKVLRHLKISVKEKAFICGGTLISGYSQIVKADAEKGVNVQIYGKKGRIYIGSPFIFGGY